MYTPTLSHKGLVFCQSRSLDFHVGMLYITPSYGNGQSLETQRTVRGAPWPSSDTSTSPLALRMLHCKTRIFSMA